MSRTSMPSRVPRAAVSHEDLNSIQKGVFVPRPTNTGQSAPRTSPYTGSSPRTQRLRYVFNLKVVTVEAESDLKALFITNAGLPSLDRDNEAFNAKVSVATQKLKEYQEALQQLDEHILNQTN